MMKLPKASMLNKLEEGPKEDDISVDRREEMHDEEQEEQENT